MLSVMRDLARKSPNVIKNCFDKNEYDQKNGDLKSTKIHVKLWWMEDNAPYKIKRYNIFVNSGKRIMGGVNDDNKYANLPLWPVYLEEAVSILLKKIDWE